MSGRSAVRSMLFFVTYIFLIVLRLFQAIFETTGRMYKVGNFKDIMYYASGTSIDWSYGTARIPFSYLVELRSKQDRFLLPREEIIVCCKEILNGVKALVEFSDKKKCLNCSVIPKKLRT